MAETIALAVDQACDPSKRCRSHSSGGEARSALCPVSAGLATGASGSVCPGAPSGVSPAGSRHSGAPGGVSLGGAVRPGAPGGGCLFPGGAMPPGGPRSMSIGGALHPGPPDGVSSGAMHPGAGSVPPGGPMHPGTPGGVYHGEPARDVDIEQLKTCVLGKVMTYVADGAAAAQKCGKILRRTCPNLVIVLRDVAHAVRRSAEDPLRREQVCGEFWSKIFDDRHALIPDIQNSAEWRQRLVLAQKHVLAKDGNAGGLTVALKHFQFAKQRFDSAASPARKYCCLVVAIAVLLAAQASDTRHPAALRRRAEQLLEEMTPTHFVTAGLFADYAAEVLRFVRLVDKDHDVACTLRQKRTFLERLHNLFLKAHIFAEPDGPDAHGSATHIAVSQAMQAGPIYYSDKVKHLWPGLLLAQPARRHDSANERPTERRRDIIMKVPARK